MFICNCMQCCRCDTFDIIMVNNILHVVCQHVLYICYTKCCIRIIVTWSCIFLGVVFIGTVKVWDPRQKDTPVANMEPTEGETRRDCWTVAFGVYL